MESLEPERIIIAAFTEADLRRLHALLVCYDSPFQTSAECDERERDRDSHEQLRRHVARLLNDQQ